MSYATTIEAAALPVADLRIEAVTPRLIKPMIDFGSIHYPPGNPNLDGLYLSWLCLENPAGPAQAVIIEVERRIVGLALLIPIELRFDGKEQLSYFVVNVLTHPEHRKRRLFSHIIDAAKHFCGANGSWLMGHPNQAALAGWKRKEMTFRAPLVGMLGGLGFGFGQRFEVLDTEAKMKATWPAVEGSIDGDPAEVRIKRSVEFMRWRFLTRPERRYCVAAHFGSNGVVAGFSVTRRFRAGVHLVVDHGVNKEVASAIALRRPSLTMVPANRMAALSAETGSHSLPFKKEIPFFATCFDNRDADFSRITLAASDF